MAEAIPLPQHRTPLGAVRDVARALLAGEEPERVLWLVAEYARELVAADLAIILCADAEPGIAEVRIAVGRGSGRIQRMRVPLEHSIAGEVIRTGIAEVVADAQSDPRAYAPTVLRAGFGPSLFVPLEGRAGVCGALCVANRRGGAGFSSHDLEVVEAFAGQASMVLDSVRAEEQLEALLETADRERTGRELHDTVIQRLFATGMTLEAARSKALPADADARVARALDDLDTTIREIRTTVFGPDPEL